MHRNSSLSCSQIVDPRGSDTSVQEVGMLSSANTTSKRTYIYSILESMAQMLKVTLSFRMFFQTCVCGAALPQTVCVGIFIFKHP